MSTFLFKVHEHIFFSSFRCFLSYELQTAEQVIVVQRLLTEQMSVACVPP